MTPSRTFKLVTEYNFRHIAYMEPSQIRDLYYKVLDSGMENIMFYDGGIQSDLAWFNFMHKGDNWLVEVTERGGRDAGMFWLNGYQGRSAQAHFCVWRDYEKKIEAGAAVIKWLKDLGQLDSLYGCTPKPFRHATSFVKALGFKVKGEIPGACYMFEQDRYVPGVLSVLDFNDIKGD